MKADGQISTRQLFILTVVFVIGTSILVAPSVLISVAREDAWIAAMLGGAVGTGTTLLYGWVGIRMRGSTLMEFTGRLLGRWTAKVLAVLIFGYVYFTCALILQNTADFVTGEILPDTPDWAVEVIFLAVVVMAVWMGLQPLARTAEIFFPWILLLILIIYVLLLPDVNLQKIRPILGEGILPVAKVSALLWAFPFLQLFLFLLIFHHVGNPEKGKKAMLAGSAVGSVVLVILMFLSIAVMGSPLMELRLYPTFTLARKINIGNFLTRIEVVLAGAWFLSSFLKLSITYYTGIKVLTALFNLANGRWLIAPLAALMMYLAHVTNPNILFSLKVYSQFLLYPSILLGFVYPLLLLVLSFFHGKQGRGKGGRKRAEET
ncbi:endospore germination permease [Paenibacillus aurantius]|uniref:Endospore germination permease n=1 Tax=Paenibacillus aurantius TaxID=2918900 RepID=A0AA96LAV4_9BACL|nr:endospore germination permease [Paenibacillus aurantius]WNQ10404.1 endospore germination permease [Paenibacillus aurantius]